VDILRNERTGQQQPPQAPGARKEEKPYTTLGKDTEFEGTLKFKEGLRIEGNFNGDIASEGHLIVGETGEVTAEIEVGSIVVEGKINGNIMASELVDLRSTAELRGDITASKLKIDEGVVFIGRSDVQPGNKSGSKSKADQGKNDGGKQDGGKQANQNDNKNKSNEAKHDNKDQNKEQNKEHQEQGH